MDEMNLAAAEQFGRRQLERPYGPPPAPEPRLPDEIRMLQAVQTSLHRTRVGLGIVLAILVPGLGLVFAEQYVAGALFFLVYAALLAAAPLYTWWLLIGAALVWVVNIIYTASQLESETFS